MVKLWTLNALIVVCIAFILFLVGYSTPYWLEGINNTPVHLGLWQVCTPTCYSNHIGYDFFLGTQAMETMGLMVAIFTVPILAFYMHVTGREGLDTIEYISWKASVVSTILSCIFILLGVIILGTKYTLVRLNPDVPVGMTSKSQFNLSWSFGLTTASACLYFLSAIMLTLDKLQPRPAV